jgi:RND family efflux transporter MFP subunit
MKRIGMILIVALTLAAGFGAGAWYAKRSAGAINGEKRGRKILYWVDPMHPAYKSDKPGIAPDCGMKLEPVYADGGPAEQQPKGRILYYSDPQDPSYRSDKPGLNPETGNELQPVYEGAPPPGTINVSPKKQQLIGVTYATAELAAGVDTVRAVGKVTQDETKITRVHPKIEGWIEKVYVDFTGQLVQRGDPLLTIYSPEMLASEQEFLLALRARDEMKRGPSREAYENSEILIEAARRRLELWDLSRAQIAEIEERRKPVRTVTLYSPASGYAVARNAFPSQRISPETELYALTDLSRVWVMADVFESDLPKIRMGQTATVSLPNEGGRSFEAKVTYIQPQINPETRTLQVRLEAPNPELRLKPDMFVDVNFRIPTPGRVTIPADAVLDTGMRKTVFIDHGNGNLEPRQVQTGDRIGDRVQILSGVAPGERVVASGAFLIDSEAQLKNPQPQAAPGEHQQKAQPQAPPPGGHQHD